MATRVGINGFGRIGRQVLKAIRDHYPNSWKWWLSTTSATCPPWHICSNTTRTTVASMGRSSWAKTVSYIDGKIVKAFKETDPANIPWGDLGIDIVVEGTGLFTIKEDGVNKKGKTVKGAVNHITKGGAKKVIITAPAEGEDLTVVLGVNEGMYDPASITSYRMPRARRTVWRRQLRLSMTVQDRKRGFMITVHAYTNDQKILDMPHRDLRRARAAALTIIPTTTGAAQGHLAGHSRTDRANSMAILCACRPPPSQ